jgi:UDP-N-acetylmuramate dehydrogenase
MEKQRYPLSGLTTLGIGGPADRYVVPETEAELADALKGAADEDQPVRALGGGANLLVSDDGIEGVVVSMNRLRGLTVSGGLLIAGAGVPTGMLVGRAVRSGLSGLECLVGVPGTAGGAVRMNAGGKYGTIGDRVAWVRGLTARGEEYVFPTEACGFGYRESRLAGTFVTEVALALTPSAENLTGRVRRIFEEKKAVQPLRAATAGCMFRNPARACGESAGRLIDLVGLRGYVCGGARISPLHANFVENRGDATFEDVLTLVRMARSLVYSRYGIDLSLEVEIWRKEEEALLVA